MPGIASAATAVVIAHVGAGHLDDPRRRGRHHAAEPRAAAWSPSSSGRSKSLFPGRIDLGLGRAPGTDPATARALRRTLASAPRTSRATSLELITYLRDPAPQQIVRAVPGAGLECADLDPRLEPVRGAGRRGARAAVRVRVALRAGALMEAIEIYRERFEPSAQLARPYVMLGVNVVAADDRRRGALSGQLAASIVHEPASGAPDSVAAAVGGVAEASRRRRRAIGGRSGAQRLDRRIGRDGPPDAGGLPRAHRRRRADHHQPDLRARPPRRVLRDRGRRARDAHRAIHSVAGRVRGPRG